MYAAANWVLCTTEAVAVEGAMLELTVWPLLRASTASQCCRRLARA